MTPEGSRISVVIPVFNRSRMIVECLESVASQSRPPDIVVVVDDGSTDGSGAAVRNWIVNGGDCDRYRLLSLPATGGAPAARNRGLELAGECDLVAFLDSDDLWPNDFLARAEEAFAAGTVAVTADLRVDRRGRNPRLRDLSAVESRLSDVLFEDAGIGSATVLSMGPVREAGGYDESYPTGHDLHLYCAVSRFGKWRHLAGAPVTKRHGHGSPGEAGRLAAQYTDRMRQWAKLHQTVIEEHGERLGLDANTRARLIAKRWYRAGKELAKQHEGKQARACFRTALRWRPLTLRPRLKLLGTFLR